MTTWPYPGDSPLARARRVARAYRARLLDADPMACGYLDELMNQWGEYWLTPALDVGTSLDDWLTPAEAADFAAVQPAQLRVWRHRGRLTGRQDANGTWRYQARDILHLLADTRRRTPLQLRSQQQHPCAQNTRRRRPGPHRRAPPLHLLGETGHAQRTCAGPPHGARATIPGAPPAAVQKGATAGSAAP